MNDCKILDLKRVYSLAKEQARDSACSVQEEELDSINKVGNYISDLVHAYDDETVKDAELRRAARVGHNRERKREV